ncbi:MAG: flippase-like domain-containing protein [Verrucomicrobiales bacterium]|jgi:uncharacterized protein (TIRG00374 family)|nr:flippase-like domain-containing protein [Verrucomicrobiales bacterium]
MKDWKNYVKLAVTLTILAIIFRRLDWHAFANELRNMQVHWLVAGFFCIGISTVTQALRWRNLLRVQHVNPTLSQTWLITMIGLFFNQFLPGSVGGDVIKAYYIVRQTPNLKERAVLAVLLDRVLGLATILFMTFLLIPWQFEKIAANREAFVIVSLLAALLACVFIGLAFLWLFPLHKLPPVFHRLWQKMPKREIFESLYAGFHAHGKALRPTLMAVFYALISVCFILSTGYLIGRAFELDISYAQMTIIFSIVLCAIALPISVSGHGLREWAFVTLFPIFAVTRHGEPVTEATALACSTMFLGLTLTWSAIGGIIYLGYSHKLKAHTSNP